ncbi:hypothetical protein BN136_3217 [Cronobacter universalis NCTC 9529]|nr:hypothetical protein BN136_3217 [Cronobacter universalis NCTC 9529]
MHRRQRQHRNGDRRPRHVDGRAERDRHRIGIAIQIQLLAQRHVDRNIRRRAAGKERGHAAFAQAGEHQRVWVTADFGKHNQRVNHQRHQEHAANQHHQQLRVTPQGIEAGGGERGRDQAENPDGRETDHQLHHKGDGIRHIIHQIFGGVVAVTQREAEAHGPDQNADVIAFQQGINRVRDHAEQQVAQHADNPGRRRDIRRARDQMQRGRKEKAEQHGGQRRGKRAQQIEPENGADIGFLPVFMVGDRGHYQHQHQYRRHGFQRADEQRAEQSDRDSRGFGKPGQQNTEHQPHQNLFYQTALRQAV